jgi:hypothetical protein
VFTPLVPPEQRTYNYEQVSSYGYFFTESELVLNGAAPAAWHERAAAATGNKFGKLVPDLPITGMTGRWESP